MEETIAADSLQILMVGIFWMLLTTLFAWKMGYYYLPKQEVEEKLPFRVVLVSFAIVILLAMLIIPIFSILAIYLYKGKIDTSPKTTTLINYFSIMIGFLILSAFQFFLSVKERELIWGKLFGPTTSLNKTLKDILMGILTWFISYPVLIVVSRMVSLTFEHYGIEVLVDQVAVSHVRAALASPLIFAIVALSVTFFVPVIEEFLFRGCLQTWLRGKLGVKNAIVVTSLIFAGFHFSVDQELGNVEILITLFSLSLFLGFIYERQQSLLASIALHSFFNGLSVLFIALS